MPAAPQARTPAKDNQGLRPVRRRQGTAATTINGVLPSSSPAPSSASTAGAAEPLLHHATPKRAKRNKPRSFVKSASKNAAASGCSPVPVRRRRGVPPPPPSVVLGHSHKQQLSRTRRYTDTAGPLDFLDAVDGGTPERPSHPSESESCEANDTPRGAITCTPYATPPPPPATLEDEVQVCVDGPTEEGEGVAATPQHQLGLSSPSSSPSSQGREEVEDVDQDKVSIGESSVAKMERSTFRTIHSGRTPTPLPATPERPMEVRFYRAARALMGSDVVLAAMLADPEGATLNADDAGEGDNEQEEDEGDTSLQLRVCGPIDREDSITYASLDDEGSGEELLEDYFNLTAPVVDVDTTVCGDGMDSTSAEDQEEEEGAEEKAGVVAGAATSVTRPTAVCRRLESALTSHEVTPTRGSRPDSDSPGLHEPQSPVRRMTYLTDFPEKKEGVAVVVASVRDDAAAETAYSTMQQPFLSLQVGLRRASDFAEGDGSHSCVSRSITSDEANDDAASDAAQLHRTNTAEPTDFGTTARFNGTASHPSTEEHTAAPLRTPSSSSSPSPTRVSCGGTDLITAHTAKGLADTSERGPSGGSSCGGTDSTPSPAHPPHCHSTPLREEGEEEGEEGGRAKSGSANLYRPKNVRIVMEVDANASELKNTTTTTAASAQVVALREVHVRMSGLVLAPATEVELMEASHVGEYRPKVANTWAAARVRVWKAALASLESLVEEYQQGLLTAMMKASRAAWLPNYPMTGLSHLITDPGARTGDYRTPSTTHTGALDERHSSTGTKSTDTTASAGEAESELRLLFRLFTNAPSPSAAEQLCVTFFQKQLERYVNWIRHLSFEFLYVHMVASRAVVMLEMHERRTVCMRRDLGIRDAIELFMLLAPRPRAPSTATGARSVISAFRMAFHAIGGAGNNSNGNSSLARPHTRSTIAAAKTYSTALVHGRPPRSAVPQSKLGPLRAPPPALAAVEEEAPVVGAAALPPPVRLQDAAAAAVVKGRLMSSERCGSGPYAVPIVRELPFPISPDQRASVAPVAAVRELEPEAVPPRENPAFTSASQPPRQRHAHRGTPRPLNTMYADHYKVVAEHRQRRNVANTLLAELHLPRLQRAASGQSQSSRTGSRVSSDRRSGSTRPDMVLSNGRLRAKESVRQKPRRRTPPPLPTETDFVDLRDDAALTRFV